MKTHKLLYLLLVLVLVLFTDCKKKILNTTIEGYVTDYYTGEPIAGAIVRASEYVFRKEGDDDVEKRSQGNSATTDENGFYRIRYKSFRTLLGRKSIGVYAKKEEEYYIRNYYYPEKEYDGGSFGENYKIKPGRKNKLDIKLKGRTRLQIHIKNVNPVNTNDVFQIGGLFLYGMNIDTLLYDSTGTDKFNTSGKLTWYVTKNNKKDTFSVIVQTPYRKETTYEIFY